ncbi:MAG: helix-turn-helix domain-containing protein [Oscillospiraceae bacterium]|nr:helix-turn-helix domain-containing protein [Oscillospiraceae bacterium]
MFGERIKKLRYSKNMNQTELAKYLNVASSTVSMWELEYNEPDIKTLIQLADLFGVTVDYLLGRESYNTTEQQAIQNLITASEIITENLKLLLKEKQD